MSSKFVRRFRWQIELGRGVTFARVSALTSAIEHLFGEQWRSKGRWQREKNPISFSFSFRSATHPIFSARNLISLNRRIARTAKISFFLPLSFSFLLLLFHVEKEYAKMDLIFLARLSLHQDASKNKSVSYCSSSIRADDIQLSETCKLTCLSIVLKRERERTIWIVTRTID